MRSTRHDVPASLVEMTLDAVDSRGVPVRSLLVSNGRPSALLVGSSPLWFGFIINDREVDEVEPGQTLQCLISFYNHEEASQVFPLGASVLFGDNVSTRGVIKVMRHDDL